MTSSQMRNMNFNNRVLRAKGEKIMSEIRRILMERDGMKRKEAKRYMTRVRKMMNKSLSKGDFLGAEQIFEDEFGLEADSLFEMFI